MKDVLRVSAALLLVTTTWACSYESATNVAPSLGVVETDLPGGFNSPIVAHPTLPQQTAELVMGRPDNSEAPWRASLEALTDAVQDVGGRAWIGFKTPQAGRSMITGVVPAMSLEDRMLARQIILDYGGDIIRDFRELPMVSAHIPSAAVAKLSGHPRIDYVEPVFVAQLQAQDTAWGAEKIRAPLAWSHFYKGANAHVTILDTGLDHDHYVSGDVDVFRLKDCAYAESSYDSCWDDEGDYQGHGTHVLGIVAGKDNSVGYIGIANKANISVVKTCLSGFGCFTDDVAAGLIWAVQQGYPRHIVNMSLGVEHSWSFEQWNQYAYENGLLLVAAAGNVPEVTSVVYPARYPEVIAVSGTLENDALATNYHCDPQYHPDGTGGSITGSQVELSAPFHAISMWGGGNYDLSCGTSMAAAHVSAVAAVTWGYHSSWSRNTLRSRLQATAIDLGASGRDNSFGYGRVDVMRAVEGKPMSVSISGPAEVPEGESCQWLSVVSGGTEPYSYSWSGALSGSSWSISGVINQDSYLNLTVTDQFGQQKSKSLLITVDEELWECVE